MSKAGGEKSALVVATEFLSRQDYSEKRLREKLAGKGIADDEADAAISTLEERGYLDDEKTCARRFERLYDESSQSLRQIKAKLAAAGFSRETIENCVPDDVFEREKKAALAVLKTKYRKPADKPKMLRTLSGRGFDFETARDAVGKFSGGEGVEDF